MSRIGPIVAAVIAISVGFIVLFSYFFEPFNNLGLLFLGWAAIVMAFALFLGVINLSRIHFQHIKTRQKGWFYSAILIISFAITSSFLL